ncbi:MAG: CPBP family glutamic-type intramembrane protease [Bacteroidetes bacterium]|nr:CPBP family glutamic-type intramembrane protease [Bacteroidota bacterium]MCY4204109.1 CPBP family glutamic-type intramembrane protease [Bacteroidota bacterium]
MTERNLSLASETDEYNYREYFRATQTATWGFLMALPLIILYELGIVWVNNGRSEVIRISSESVLKNLFSGFGLAHELILLGSVLIIGVAILIYERKKKISFNVRYSVWVMIESAAYGVILAFVVSGITQMLLSPLMISQVMDHGLAMKLVLSLGAGIYEELLFRVVIVGGFFLLLRLAFPKQRILMYAVAAVIGAISFSAVHHLGSLGDPWALDVFLYRAIFGLVFNILFLVRGFAVVAWTHALYDVMVVTGFFSLLQSI